MDQQPWSKDCKIVASTIPCLICSQYKKKHNLLYMLYFTQLRVCLAHSSYKLIMKSIANCTSDSYALTELFCV